MTSPRGGSRTLGKRLIGDHAAYDHAAQMQKSPVLRKLPAYWDKYQGGRYKAEYEVPTAVAEDKLNRITEKLTTYPEGFAIHPKVKKLLDSLGEKKK